MQFNAKRMEQVVENSGLTIYEIANSLGLSVADTQAMLNGKLVASKEQTEILVDLFGESEIEYANKHRKNYASSFGG